MDGSPHTVSQITELFPGPQPLEGQYRRTLVALLAALAVHALLLTLPVALVHDAPSRRAPIHITIQQPEPPPTRAVEKPLQQQAPPTSPAKPEPSPTSTKPNDTKRTRAAPRKAPQAETKTQPTDTDVTKTTDALLPSATPIPPATRESSGAKSRSTVFDPELARKLRRARKKIRRFKPTETYHRTATGTFIQQGDRCWEVIQLVPGDTSSESSQWLRKKCPNNSRSRAEIDRLARKYGIP